MHTFHCPICINDVSIQLRNSTNEIVCPHCEVLVPFSAPRIDDWQNTQDTDTMIFALGKQFTQSCNINYSIAICKRLKRLIPDHFIVGILNKIIEYNKNPTGQTDLLQYRADLAESIAVAAYENWADEALAEFGWHPAESMSFAYKYASSCIGRLYDRITNYLLAPSFDPQRTNNNEIDDCAIVAYCKEAEAYILQNYNRQKQSDPDRRSFIITKAQRLIESREQELYCSFIRDLVSPATIDWKNIQTSESTIHVSKYIKSTEDFSLMPILADSLEESGCTNEFILNHCRSDCIHIYGCWVLEGLLLNQG